MSTNQINFSNINYAYKTHSFFSSEADKILTSTDDEPIKIEKLLSVYKKIFGYHPSTGTAVIGTAEIKLKNLLDVLGKILDYEDLKIDSMNTTGFYASAKTIYGKTIDSNTLATDIYLFFFDKLFVN